MTFEYINSKQDGINTYALKGELIDKTQSAELLQEIDSAIIGTCDKYIIVYFAYRVH